MSAWSVKIRRAPSRQCRDARVYTHATTTMHDNEYTPPPPPVCLTCVCVLWSGRGWPGRGRCVREDALQWPGCQAKLLSEGRVPAADLQEPRHAVPASGGPRGACFLAACCLHVAFSYVAVSFSIRRCWYVQQETGIFGLGDGSYLSRRPAFLA